MKTRKIHHFLLLAGLLTVLTGLVSAQSTDPARRLKMRSASPDAARERALETQTDERQRVRPAPGFDSFTAGTGLPDTVNRAKEAQEKMLVGSYEATFVSAEDPAAFPPLPALFTFGQGGTFIETDGGGLAATPPPNPTFGSPGHGAWQRIGDNLFAVKFVIIVVNQNGTLALKGTIKLKIRLAANGRSFEGEGTFDFVDADGNPIEGGFGHETVSGTKIDAE